MFNLRIRLIVNINKIDIHLCGIKLKTMSLFYNTMSLGDINYKRQGKKIKIKREESIKKLT